MIRLRLDKGLLAGMQLLLLMLSSMAMLPACQSYPKVEASPQALSLPDRQRLDRLLTLMDQRLEVAVMVAQSKWNSGAPIDDPERERQILDAMSASLTAMNPGLARRFFQAQFDAGKIIQRALHAQWRAQAHERFANPPDLVRDIRPALDRITPSLIDALRQATPLLYGATDPRTAARAAMARSYVQQRKATLLRGDADGAAREEALRPLLESGGVMR